MDIILTVTSPGLYAPVAVRELYQFHPVIVITNKVVALQIWTTDKDWKHESE